MEHRSARQQGSSLSHLADTRRLPRYQSPYPSRKHICGHTSHPAHTVSQLLQPQPHNGTVEMHTLPRPKAVSYLVQDIKGQCCEQLGQLCSATGGADITITAASPIAC